MRNALKLALILPLFALMAPTGGFPSRPTFQHVTIPQNGSISVGCNSSANPIVICATAGNSGLAELAGNGTIPGTTSLAVGQSATGQAVILARGAESLLIGANAGGQIQIASNGAISGNIGTTAVGTWTQVTNAACTAANPARGMSCATDNTGLLTTITFSPAFATAPTCTVANAASGASATLSASPLPSTTTAKIVTSAATQTFFIVCST